MGKKITREDMIMLYAWLKTADMFHSSPEGREFAETLKAVFILASDKLEEDSNK